MTDAQDHNIVAVDFIDDHMRSAWVDADRRIDLRPFSCSPRIVREERKGGFQIRMVTLGLPDAELPHADGKNGKDVVPQPPD